MGMYPAVKEDDGVIKMTFSFNVEKRLMGAVNSYLYQHPALIEKLASYWEDEWRKLSDSDRKELLRDALAKCLEKFTIRDMHELKKMLSLEKDIKRRWKKVNKDGKKEDS